MDIPDTDFEPYCTTYGHAPVAGMTVVDLEDLIVTARERRAAGDHPIACLRCDGYYLPDRGWM